jgi:hypothetical protein
MTNILVLKASAGLPGRPIPSALLSCSKIASPVPRWL